MSFALAVLVAMLAGPRLSAEWQKLDGRAPLALLSEGEFPTEAGFQRIVDSGEAAMATYADPATSEALGLAHLAWGLVAQVERRDASPRLDQAKRWFETTLEMAPARHVAWYLLAQAELMGGRLPEAAAALARSYRAVPLDFDNAVARLSVSLQLLDQLDFEALELVATEVELTAMHDLRGLVQTAVDGGRFEEVLALLEVREVDELTILAYVQSVRKQLGANRR